MQFDRFKSRTGKTWAFESFIAHHTEVNNMYWAFVPTWSYTDYLARTNPGLTPEVLYHAKGPDVHRLESNMAVFIQHSNQLSNWVRLSALLSAAAYLETYINRVVRLSLLSDPAVRLGKTRIIDGVSWLKNDIRDDVESLVTSCIKGDWSSRIAGFKKLFGGVPPIMERELVALEGVRNTRNRVGHSFGRDIKISLLELQPEVAESLNESSLKATLQLIFDVARDSDDFLLGRHIGSFEEILHFHEWRRKLKGTSRLDEDKAFKKELGHLKRAEGVTLEYCRGLVDYYHAC